MKMSLARTSIRWTTLAGITVESINANAFVQTGPRGTFIYVFLTVDTYLEWNKNLYLFNY